MSRADDFYGLFDRITTEIKRLEMGMAYLQDSISHLRLVQKDAEEFYVREQFEK